MNVNAIDSGRIEAMLAQLKAAAQRPPTETSINPISAPTGTETSQASSGVNFSDALKASLDQVNQTQLRAEQLGKNFALGDDSVSLSDVMIAGQKANISFQATLQVRNKLVSAYQEIMNMQV